jgi:hypothetical protein
LCAKERLRREWRNDIEEVDHRGGKVDIDLAIGICLLEKGEKGSEVAGRRLRGVLFFKR